MACSSCCSSQQCVVNKKKVIADWDERRNKSCHFSQGGGKDRETSVFSFWYFYFWVTEGFLERKEIQITFIMDFYLHDVIKPY